MKDFCEKLTPLLGAADAILIGAGAGLSASAGLHYSGERFQRIFPDFIEKYHIPDMYSGGFYPFATPEEQWGYWSRHVYHNRLEPQLNDTYDLLQALVAGLNYFVLTTNVDHSFQRAGFDKNRLFYTQGDYGLWQCSVPCHQATYDNEDAVRQMVAQQRDMKIPSSLVPHCPKCGAPMDMNLRKDDTFVQDQGWYQAAGRYQNFLAETQGKRVVFLELGVGFNTPTIIKYPFMQRTYGNPHAHYVTINQEESYIPKEISSQSLSYAGDIRAVLQALATASA